MGITVQATGQLDLVVSPDYEAPTDADGDNTYEVIVRADDGLGGIATQPIDVHVTPVNELPVALLPDSDPSRSPPTTDQDVDLNSEESEDDLENGLLHANPIPPITSDSVSPTLERKATRERGRLGPEQVLEQNPSRVSRLKIDNPPILVNPIKLVADQGSGPLNPIQTATTFVISLASTAYDLLENFDSDKFWNRMDQLTNEIDPRTWSIVVGAASVGGLTMAVTVGYALTTAS